MLFRSNDEVIPRLRQWDVFAELSEVTETHILMTVRYDGETDIVAHVGAAPAPAD